ncbi:MAG: transposase, partial [Candidatus Omnitrophica bacterium]|nr:transposase [Candidatus Omnitrophota bacterium]
IRQTRAIRELPLQIRRRNMLLSKMVGYIKMRSAKQINVLRNCLGKSVWQRNYYDHIVRNDKSLQKIREYIRNNPLTWKSDFSFYSGIRESCLTGILFDFDKTRSFMLY